MSLFKVEKIINGNTIIVNPKWKLNGVYGNEVVIRGYNPTFKNDSKIKNDVNMCEGMISRLELELSTNRLKNILLEKLITLKILPMESSDCIDNNGVGKFRAYLNDVDISCYFPDFS